MKAIRLLVYEGPEDWLVYQKEHDNVKGTHIVGPEKKITSVYLGALPDRLSIALASIDKIAKSVKKHNKLETVWSDITPLISPFVTCNYKFPEDAKVTIEWEE